MRLRLITLWLAGCAAALGQANFVWDYPTIAYPPPPVFTANGDTTFMSSAGGGLIYTPAVSGANANNYEMRTVLSASQNLAGGTYMHFLRASSNAAPGVGSYISVEFAVPSGWQSGGTAPLTVNQSVSGTITELGSSSAPIHNGDIVRSVVWGTTLWVFVNNTQYFSATIPLTTGQPGYGGHNAPSTNLFAAWVGHHDTVAPTQLSGTAVATSVFPTSVSLKWQGVADDSVGIGVYEYYIARNGTAIGKTIGAEFADSTVLAATTYTYTIQAVDYHGNLNAGTTVTVTTPAAGAIDPRRTGVYTTGSYWGGGGEQIDTLSGNLNFSLPLLAAQGRTGWTVPVGLVYNSQNWRQDGGVNWKLGNDVGYGFGWQLLIGSITPYYTSYYNGVDHYVYTDSTGAQYRLTVNNGGVWSGTNGVYVWFDSNTDKLHFRDGSFWVMGCTSGGAEADAGTMYPTIIEDVSGNQVIVGYGSGAGLTSSNTSARLGSIEDGRNTGWISYGLIYNSDTPVPHLSYITDEIGTGAGHTFTYAENVAIEPPFGTDPNYAGLTTTQLAGMTVPGVNPYQFTYDSAGASELLQAKFPWGGHLRWTYATDPYSASRDLRAVSGRYLAADSAGTTEWSYGISRDNALASGAIVHGTMTLSDASGIGAKTWNFFNTSTSPAWEIGLASEFVQSASSGGTVLQDDLYTWSQDPAGNPYISTKASTIGQGTSNVETATSTQTLDQYGNVTQSVVYPYNNTTTPLKTFNNTYLSSSTYTSNYIFNRLVSSSVTPSGGSAITLVTNTYDGGNCTTDAVLVSPPIQCGGWATPTSSPTDVMDPSPPIPPGQRGYLKTSVTPATTTTVATYTYGSPAVVWGSDGTVSSASADTSTNFNAPVTITSQSYTTTMAYNSWLGVTQTTGANGEQLSMTYDSYGRPTSGTSPYGATTSYNYGTSNPFTQTKTGTDGKTITTLDGLGRSIQVDRGDTTSMHSSTATVYAPCACSPLAKIQKTSRPYIYGGSASAWTTYAYDGLGRPLTVQQPDGASTTTYVYSGNVTTVTDPAGKWKQFTTDVSGNLVTATEPDPANPPSGTVTTTYTYDWMNHVIGVSMVRAGTTQTRSFVYDNAGRLTSATNPENGTVSYVYGTNNAVQSKTDAKGQQTVYTYDSLNRLTMTKYYPTGTANPEDGCQRVTYSYDTNPINPSFSQNSLGRLTAVQYGANTIGSYTTSVCVSGEYTTYLTGSSYTTNTSFAEMYSYHPAGGVTAKQLYMSRQYPGIPYGNAWYNENANLEVDYTYDNAGRTASTTYPFAIPYHAPLDPVTFSYGYDSMGRPASLTDSSGTSGTAWYMSSGPVNWVQNVQYDYAGRMSSMQSFVGSDYNDPFLGAIASYATKAMTYNVNGQLSSLSWSTSPDPWDAATPAVGIQYVYSATQNNGQITQAVDTLSGETISYAYDSLKRLTSASSSPISGSSPAPSAWTQSYQYDGFGNLTAKVLNGTTTSIPVNAATNRLSSASYDANGNMTSGAGATMVYDEANRIFSATEVSGGAAYYAYTADNKRFYTYNASSGAEQLTFYGARGEKLGVYSIVAPASPGYPFSLTATATNIWFAGKMIVESNQIAYQDRLGTNRSIQVYDSYAPAGNGGRFYPYGDEITSTANDHEKFATYTRDSYTGFDYADQRYYASTYGRFNTADPSGAKAADSTVSGSWNMYGYAANDPVGNSDPTGLDPTLPCGPDGIDPITGNICVTGTGTAPDVGSNVPLCFSDPFLCGMIPGTAGGGGGGGGGTTPPPQKPTCNGLPDGVVLAVSAGAAAGLGIQFGGEVVFNMNTGQVSAFSQYTFTASGFATPSGSLQSGFIWGLGQSNASYSGPFTSVSVGAGVFAATAATTSRGWTNPFSVSRPTSVTAGVQTPAAGFSYGLAHYSNPFDIGNLNNPVFRVAFSALTGAISAAVQSYYSMHQGLCGSY